MLKFNFYIIIFWPLMLSSFTVAAQENSFISKEIGVSPWIDGTLLMPSASSKTDLVIIIAGSGPTDRNGNQMMLENDALKKLAIGLANNGIASYRYDKRVVKQLLKNKIDPNTSFDDFVLDAKAVISYFKSSKTFANLFVLGHSQGSLVGMLAAKDNADGFISLAGAGQNIGNVIVNQVTAMDENLGLEAKKVVAVLKEGKTTNNFPIMLASVFRKDLQPFMINWMAYNPDEIIAKLNIPILIINGTKDLQVPVEEAKRLKAANTNAELVIIDAMNHVLFEIEGDAQENSKSYNEAFRPVSESLVKSITKFVKAQ